ncbi:TIGR02452 family protein [Rhizophagus clarus]|uniref:TIGR02452 family protein n=1 Tax=Rhizophagus clarus TaxID=94130 RepID=A0A8H3M8Z0_9GLOM|nr:TIGR02452 family protein [Rhizophagus clarus]
MRKKFILLWNRIPLFVIVQYETFDVFNSDSPGYENKSGKRILLDPTSISSEIKKSKLYKDGTSISRPIVAQKQPNPKIQVLDGDCLNHASRLKSEGYNPIVLNMANAEVPGGGYLDGSGAQEENLFRRTNLFQYHEPNKDQWYPIPLFGGIYCPNATVIKASEQEEYELLEKPEKMSFVAVAAISHPKLVDNNNNPTLNEHDKEITRQKIRTILNIGLDNGHDAIVLSAFGCGAFANPPSTIAQLFYEWKNGEGNLLPFKNRFANGIPSTEWVKQEL